MPMLSMCYARLKLWLETTRDELSSLQRGDLVYSKESALGIEGSEICIGFRFINLV